MHVTRDKISGNRNARNDYLHSQCSYEHLSGSMHINDSQKDPSQTPEVSHDTPTTSGRSNNETNILDFLLRVSGVQESIS